jgi:hypothetical protein
MSKSFLQMIETSAKPQKQSILLYGVPGCGKTSLAANFPGVLFVTHPLEDGINTLKLSKQVSPDIPVITLDKWEDVESLVEELIENDVPYKHVAFDSLGRFEKLLHEYVCREHFQNDWEKFQQWGKGPDKAVAYFCTFLNKVAQLKVKGIGPIFLGHTQIKPHNDPQRGSYDTISIDVSKQIFGEIRKWVDIIGFIEFVISVQEEKGKPNKALGGKIRQMHLDNAAVFEAKNRHGIKKPVNLGNSAKEGFKNFMDAFKQGKENEQVEG